MEIDDLFMIYIALKHGDFPVRYVKKKERVTCHNPRVFRSESFWGVIPGGPEVKPGNPLSFKDIRRFLLPGVTWDVQRHGHVFFFFRTKKKGPGDDCLK